MKWSILALFIMLSTIACTPHVKNNAATNNGLQKGLINKKLIANIDTVVYEYNSVIASDSTCNDCHISITYPIIKNKPALKDTINHILFGYIGNPDTNENFESFFEKYAKAYGQTDGSVNAADNKNIVETYDYNITIVEQDPGLIVFDLREEQTGGAHPNALLNFLNWDTKTDEEVALDDILIQGYEPRLTTIAEKIFRKQERLREKEPLTNFFFEDGEFALNGNFKLTSEGISFFYNSYEIQPYIDGPTELLIPYASIKQLLRPNTVTTQFIK